MKSVGNAIRSIGFNVEFVVVVLVVSIRVSPNGHQITEPPSWVFHRRHYGNYDDGGNGYPSHRSSDARPAVLRNFSLENSPFLERCPVCCDRVGWPGLLCPATGSTDH